jgi:hypothetical protein
VVELAALNQNVDRPNGNRQTLGDLSDIEQLGRGCWGRNGNRRTPPPTAPLKAIQTSGVLRDNPVPAEKTRYLRAIMGIEMKPSTIPAPGDQAPSRTGDEVELRFVCEKCERSLGEARWSDWLGTDPTILSGENAAMDLVNATMADQRDNRPLSAMPIPSNPPHLNSRDSVYRGSEPERISAG